MAADLAPLPRSELRVQLCGDPLILQAKQASKSVLEPYLGATAYEHAGQKVVAGQRLMQAASDIFLGWMTGRPGGRHFYWRQLRDMKAQS